MAAVAAFAAPEPWKISPGRVGALALWCGDRLYIVEHRDPRTRGCVELMAEWPAPDEYTDLADIARVAFTAGAGAVWLLPAEGTQPGPNDPAWMRQWAVYARLAMARSATLYEWHEISANKGTALAGLCAQRRGLDGKGRGLPLCLYATWIDAWPILGALSGVTCPERRAVEAATGLALTAYVLGAQLRFSPSYTGFSVLRETLAAKAYAITPLSDDWREVLRPILPGPIQWYRPIRQADILGVRADGHKARLNVYAYDRVASYVASAREVPVGDPQIVDRFHPGLPGVYRLDAEAPDGWAAPGIFRVGAGAGGYPRAAFGVWAWEPQVRCALACGWPLTIYEGYCWPKAQKHDLLRAWQQRIWGAREAAAAFPGPAGMLAARLCKKIGVATIGRLKQRKGHMLVSAEQAYYHRWPIQSRQVDARGRLTGDVEVIGDLGKTDLIQIHWWATIIANANERLQHAIIAHAPRDTIGAYIDALYTLWPHEALEGPEAGARLGKFRRVHRQTIGRSQLAELDEVGPQGFVKWLAHHRPSGGPSELETAWDELDDDEGADDE